VNGNTGFYPTGNRKGGLILDTDGSKTNKGTESGVYSYGTRWMLSFTVERYTAVFQAKVHTIKACTVEKSI
jgi:hypothetical protein